MLPAFGVFSEVISTFTGKRLFGYTSMVWASGAITILAFIVWLHHFFTMGSGANVNAFFGVATMIIAVPTGPNCSTGSSPSTVAVCVSPLRYSGLWALW